MHTCLSTPEGQETARIVLSRALGGLNLPLDIKGKILAAVEEKKRPVA